MTTHEKQHSIQRFLPPWLSSLLEASFHTLLSALPFPPSSDVLRLVTLFPFPLESELRLVQDESSPTPKRTGIHRHDILVYTKKQDTHVLI